MKYFPLKEESQAARAESGPVFLDCSLSWYLALDQRARISENKQKSFWAEFKAKETLEAIRGIKTLNWIAQEFGVHPVQASTWKEELQQQASTLFERKCGLKTDDRSRIQRNLFRDCPSGNGARRGHLLTPPKHAG
jgi:hypothetical protein